ncbi:hypothetical protein, partial [Cognatishimia sp. MH4019]|uniref:hypothetical protein n=1 Tax=Cognatishimia sp. MH4019 TaxID=2854030 RepID=UPI001CD4F910
RIRKTAPLVPPALVPSSPNPPINKGIESAITTSIKQEFFNTIGSNRWFAIDFLARCAPKAPGIARPPHGLAI